jgi:bifunctional DNA-binding transcriptional regulator/antitoxin component of YhaV-PrlF toxin-antitoxin module
MVDKVKVKIEKKSARDPKAKAARPPLQRVGRTSTSRISAKNQVTVPVDILRAMGLHAGDEVEFRANDAGFIELSLIRRSSIVEMAGRYGDVFEKFDLEKERQSWNQ